MNDDTPLRGEGTTLHPSTQASQFPPTALITGGGSGIGKAAALRFLKEGWNVVLVGRRLDPLQEIASQYHGRALALSCDLSRPDEVTELISTLEQVAFGERLMALINNAGAYERRSLKDSDDAFWSSMFEANVLTAVRLTRGLMPLLEKNKGVVINVSSTLGVRPVPDTGAYSAAKAAMINWTESLALESAACGVRANAICPGIVDTPIHPFHTQEPSEKNKTLATLNTLQPLGRIGRPEEIAHAIWSLCAPGAEWITGASLNVDGGISLV